MLPWLKTIYVCTSLSAAFPTQATACKMCIGGSTLNSLGDISECAGSCWFVHKLSFSSSIGTSLHILNHSRWSFCHAIQWLRFKLKALTRMYFFLWNLTHYITSDDIHRWSSRSKLWIKEETLLIVVRKQDPFFSCFVSGGLLGLFWVFKKVWVI